MKPGFLSSPDVVAWLDGIEPVWTLLTYESWCAVNYPADGDRPGIRLNETLEVSRAASSPMVANAQTFLRRCSERDGLALTEAGNLNRRAVALLIEETAWPGHDFADALSVGIVVNESDVLPLNFLRLLLAAARLIRKDRRNILATREGKRLLRQENSAALFYRLFLTMFEKMDLGWLFPFYLEEWPQGDWPHICWCLSVVATDWQTPRSLSRLCTIPVNGILDAQRDIAPTLLEGRLLRPLAWLGLLEVQIPEDVKDRYQLPWLYRTTPLFGCFFSFDVDLETPSGGFH